MGTHVILRDELVDEIDRHVGNGRRSEFINAMVEEHLKRLRLVASADLVAGAIKDTDVPGWETEASTREWVRKMRTEPGSDP